MSEKLVGRELDAAVAENIMDWVRVPIKSILTDFQYRTPSQIGLMWPSSVPRYSTDIAAAFQVVEKSRRWSMHFRRSRSESMWTVLFVRCDTAHEVQSVSLPEAICRAALSAVEKENQ